MTPPAGAAGVAAAGRPAAPRGIGAGGVGEAVGGRPENPAMARGQLWQDFVEESRIMTVEG
ncbi:hypothetical protein [Alicyclobacillus mali (ex Roth et al. 2021)]|uniref:hypothetical protein n=1 Tax=Alicyclobacillus mali (ex Roth et al. 2021) TaxID=1123961 RepID=UPI000ABC47BB|nr:hypothetical protein [Alicyclobacillus mali (ex Roth et al. 2021)]